MIKQNQKGFTLVEGILIFIAVILLAGVGTYVYKANKDSEKQNANSSATGQQSTQNKTSESSQASNDPTAGWVKYTDPGNTYEFKHPKGWLTKDCDGLLMIAPNEQSQGVCNSDGISQVSISTFTVESGQLYLDGTEFNNFVEETIKISGYDAKKQSGVYKESGFIGPQAGDSVVQYLLNAKGTYYRISYFNLAERNFTDVKSDFEKMMEKTLVIK